MPSATEISPVRRTTVRAREEHQGDNRACDNHDGSSTTRLLIRLTRAAFQGQAGIRAHCTKGGNDMTNGRPASSRRGHIAASVCSQQADRAGPAW